MKYFYEDFDYYNRMNDKYISLNWDLIKLDNDWMNSFDLNDDSFYYMDEWDKHRIERDKLSNEINYYCNMSNNYFFYQNILLPKVKENGIVIKILEMACDFN